MKFEEVVNQIKHRADLVSIVGEFIALTKNGNNYLGLCPFHLEKTPSFSIKSNESYFKCFGCNASGDVFTFLQKKTGLTFFNVVQKMSDKYKIQLDFNSGFQFYKQTATLLEQAQIFFQKNLTGVPLLYLTQDRGYCLDTIQKLGLGFGAPNKNQSFNLFNSRITIPIRDEHGVLLGFGGRALKLENSKIPKYINSPSNKLFEKGRILYGLYESLELIRKYKNVVVVEGYFDAIALLSIGIPCVALCGTGITLHHIDLLKKYVSEVILCFDQDIAGAEVRRKALLKFLNKGFAVKDMKLSQKDPDAMLRMGLAKQIIYYYNSAKDSVQVEIENMLNKGIHGITGRIQALQNITPFLFAHTEESVNRQYIKLAAKLLQENETVFYQYAKNTKTTKINKSKPLYYQSSVQTKWTSFEELVLKILIKYPELLKNNKKILSFNLNSDLLFFIERLFDLKSNESYLNINLPKESSVIEKLSWILCNPINISLKDAERILYNLSLDELQNETLQYVDKEDLLFKNKIKCD